MWRANAKDPVAVSAVKTPHETESVCPLIKGPYLCINCKAQHLATDKSYPNCVEQCLIIKVAAYKNIPIKEASILYNQENKSVQSANSLIDVKKLLSKHTSSLRILITLIVFSLRNADLDSALGTTNSNIQPSYASKISKPKSPRKPQDKALSHSEHHLHLRGDWTCCKQLTHLYPHHLNLSLIIPLPYLTLTRHTYFYSIYHIYYLFLHSYSIN